MVDFTYIKTFFDLEHFNNCRNIDNIRRSITKPMELTLLSGESSAHTNTYESNQNHPDFNTALSLFTILEGDEACGFSNLSRHDMVEFSGDCPPLFSHHREELNRYYGQNQEIIDKDFKDGKKSISLAVLFDTPDSNFHVDSRTIRNISTVINGESTRYLSEEESKNLLKNDIKHGYVGYTVSHANSNLANNTNLEKLKIETLQDNRSKGFDGAFGKNPLVHASPKSKTPKIEVNETTSVLYNFTQGIIPLLKSTTFAPEHREIIKCLKNIENGKISSQDILALESSRKVISTAINYYW